tara:strand:+ start:31 stop:204 length:174 start_codon:yes stop_codon:yes gene_type:complete
MAKQYINILSIVAGAEDQYIDTQTVRPGSQPETDPKPTRNSQKCVETARYEVQILEL